MGRAHHRVPSLRSRTEGGTRNTAVPTRTPATSSRTFQCRSPTVASKAAAGTTARRSRRDSRTAARATTDAARASVASWYPSMLMLWTRNTEVPTPTATATRRRAERPCATFTSTPAASPVPAAMTPGRISASRRGFIPVSDDTKAATTAKPGRPGFAGPGGGRTAGRSCTPTAFATVVRHA